ncbi:MAG: hypothetical protein CSA55_03160 [Ilumatobacter coccineus]|uniref:2-oxoacid dehydrogenase acyltransferase catalytic domain-containing protein n=1 Tax=Ilumatobacter coccineus TaxID=467094 RepID=A0A2G6KAB7_9ACTN|nr:MAG: hypothetical protein CSA55_03160 [Ilumatobacter coccineus]
MAWSSDVVWGVNSWLVDEIKERARRDPSSVDQAWHAVLEASSTVLSRATAAVSGSALATPLDAPGDPIRGASAIIAANMTSSLTIPTATGFRTVSARALERNRAIINRHRVDAGLSKISFTHLIAYALVRSISDLVPVMAHSFAEASDGSPRRIADDHINLGIAVDVERPGGERGLMVPVLSRAERWRFDEFVTAYNDLVERVRDRKISPDELSGANVTITNPGMLGTGQSIPRLMVSQGTIIGIGSIAYPPGFTDIEPDRVRSLGVSKVVTLTSTYDHRVIQGAESGRFLQRVDQLLCGEHGFYESVFSDLQVADDPVGSSDGIPPAATESEMLAIQSAVTHLIEAYRREGYQVCRPGSSASGIDLGEYGLGEADLDRVVHTAGIGGRETAPLGDLIDALATAYCRTLGVEFGHLTSTEQTSWIIDHLEGPPDPMSSEAMAHLLERLLDDEARQRQSSDQRDDLPLALVLDSIAAAGVEAGIAGLVIGRADGGGDLDIRLAGSGSLAVETVPSRGDPVVTDAWIRGIARGRADAFGDAVATVVVHRAGDLVDSGVVAECVMVGDRDAYGVGGTIRVVLDDRERDRRSGTRSMWAPTTSPVIHVDGDDPEACWRAGQLAWGLRQRWGIDVTVSVAGADLAGRHPRQRYIQRLVERGELTIDAADELMMSLRTRLERVDEVSSPSPSLTTISRPAVELDLSLIDPEATMITAEHAGPVAWSSLAAAGVPVRLVGREIPVDLVGGVPDHDLTVGESWSPLGSGHDVTAYRPTPFDRSGIAFELGYATVSRSVVCADSGGLAALADQISGHDDVVADGLIIVVREGVWGLDGLAAMGDDVLVVQPATVAEFVGALVTHSIDRPLAVVVGSSMGASSRDEVSRSV